MITNGLTKPKHRELPMLYVRRDFVRPLPERMLARIGEAFKKLFSMDYHGKCNYINPVMFSRYSTYTPIRHLE